MIAEFELYVKDNTLFDKKDNILLAVSGGIDSVVLSHLLHVTGYILGIAHCNFQLRGEHSDLDETFVRQWSERLGVPFFSEKFDVGDYATSQKISIQMSARELRYNWFDDIAKECNYKHIATAHHLSDSIETALFNFAKGTGIAGIRGVLPKQNHIIRPLLFATKNQITEYAKNNNLEWREDSTNSSDQYHRNHIRHNIIPELKKINPSLEQTSKDTLQRLRDVEAIALHYANQSKASLYHQKDGGHYFNIEKLSELVGIHTLLYTWLNPLGFNFEQVKTIASSLDNTGNLFISSSHITNIDRKYLVVSPRKEENVKQFFIQKRTTKVQISDFLINVDHIGVPDSLLSPPKIALLDEDKLQFPLVVRKWEKGDKFCPLGMDKYKKVSDYLIDCKVPLILKSRVHVLETDGNIAWLIGHRIDNKFKITESTNRVLRLSIT